MKEEGVDKEKADKGREQLYVLLLYVGDVCRKRL